MKKFATIFWFLFLTLFSAFRVTFAPFASGNPNSNPNPERAP
jgi:hypothetical protein